MSGLTIFLLLIIICGSLSIVFFINYGKITYYVNKITYAENLISEDVNKKAKLLVKINNVMKKTLHAKKDYLAGINDLKDDQMDVHDKDEMLNTYTNTVKNLISDYTKLANHKELKKLTSNLYDINEKLDASKIYFNKYMKELSSLSTTFPTNIISKIVRVNIKPLYPENEITSNMNQDL